MPVEAIAGAIDALAAMVTKAIPSDQERMARLKLNHPWLYRRAFNKVLNGAERWAKHRKGLTLKECRAYADLMTCDKEDEQNIYDLICSYATDYKP